MARQAPDSETRLKALQMLREGASIRETARTLELSPATVHKWKAAADPVPDGESSDKVAGVRERSPNASGERSRTFAPDKASAERPPNAFEALLREKDSRIEDLQATASDLRRTVATLSDALSEEREARRRADVMLQHALARPALPPFDGASAPSGSRWEKVFFAVVLASLSLLVVILILR